MNKNSYYQKQAHLYIPGGAHTYSRGDDQYPLNAPPVLDRGKGAYVWDADGNKFLDYGMALRAITVGYDYEPISEAAIQEIRKGNNLTRASVTEIEAAQRFVELVPYADSVKFAKNGSTVTSAAVKLARAFTGRKYVARCRQHPFFSFDDWFIGDTVMNKGVPAEIASLTLGFDYNNLASLERLFNEKPGEIAAVIMEPETSEAPTVYSDGTNFLQKVEALCKKNGCIFILDEMITGFRWGFPGAAERYGVRPDLATFGKGIANGFSVAALVGKKEIMQLGGIQHAGERLFLISTTHGAEMSGLGALMKTIDVYKRLNVVEKLMSYGTQFRDLLNGIALEKGLEKFVQIAGYPSSPVLITRNSAGEICLGFRTLLSQELIKNGVLMPWIAFSYQHGPEELELTASAYRKALEIYGQALERGLEGYLNGRPIKPVFRKFN